MKGKRYCECGRELEYRCRVCSECRQVNIDLAYDKRNASEAHKKAVKKYYHEVYKHRYPSLKRLREMRAGNAI